MGSGKTTLGRALAQRVPGWRFIDLDEEIERHTGMSIRKFFTLHGEAAFRTLEAETLRAVAEEAALSHIKGEGSENQPVTVVACGGGTPCRPGAMELMNRYGVTVLLEASPERLLARLTEGALQRPLLRDKTPAEIAQFIRSEQMRRAPWYNQAMLRFPSDRLESEAEIAESCELFLNSI